MTAILLQNPRKVYYKMRQVFYFKMQVLLQNATVITYCDVFTTKCNSYYKMRRLLHIETVQLATSHVPVTMFLHKCKRHWFCFFNHTHPAKVKFKLNQNYYAKWFEYFHFILTVIWFLGEVIFSKFNIETTKERFTSERSLKYLSNKYKLHG